MSPLRQILFLSFTLLQTSGSRSEEAPTITKHPEDTRTQAEKSTSLQCTVSGSPTPHVTWLHNGQSVGEDPEISQYSDASGMSHTLLLLKPQESDGGEYVCRASNQLGAISSRPATLIVTPTDSESDADTKETKLIGERTDIQCGLQMRPEEIVWKLQKSPKSPAKPVKMNPKRVVMTPSMNLHITDLRLDDNGTYFCQSAADASQSGPRTLLTILAPPEFTTKPSNKTATLKGEVIFVCLVEGFPKPAITWRRKDNLPFPESRTRHFPGEHSISVSNISMADEGEYVCEASNGVGKTISASAFLTILEGPGFKKKPKDTFAVVGQTVMIDCVPLASESWKPVLYWRKVASDLSVFMGAQDGRRRVLSNGTFVIENVTLSDRGEYECAILREQHTTVAITLEVREATGNTPPLLLRVPSNTTVVRGGNLTLECEATGFDMPSISWVKDGTTKISSHSNNRVTLQNSGYLTIRDVQFGDAGLYTCQVSSPSGDNSWSATVRVVSDESSWWMQKERAKQLPARPLVVYPEWVDETAVRVAWIMPSIIHNSSFTVEYYGISPDSKFRWITAVSGESQSWFTVQNLSPATAYIFTVRAGNQFGYGPLAITSQIVSTLASQDHPVDFQAEMTPLKLKIASQFSRFAVLTWKIPVGAARSSGYRIMYCQPTPSSGHRQSCTNAQINDHRFRSYMLNNLTPFTNYTVHFHQIFEDPKMDDNTPSTLQSFVTAEDVPSEPPQDVIVSSRDSKEFSVQWNPPNSDSINGELILYQITCILESTNETLINISVDYSIRQQTIRHSLSKGRIAIMVAARTHVGIGEYSEPLYITIGVTRPTNLGWVRDTRFVAILGGMVWVMLLSFCVYLFLRHYLLRKGVVNAQYPNAMSHHEFPMMTISRDGCSAVTAHEGQWNSSLRVDIPGNGAAFSHHKINVSSGESSNHSNDCYQAMDYYHLRNCRNGEECMASSRSLHPDFGLGFMTKSQSRLSTDYTNSVAQNILPTRMKTSQSVHSNLPPANLYEEAPSPTYHLYSPYAPSNLTQASSSQLPCQGYPQYDSADMQCDLNEKRGSAKLRVALDSGKDHNDDESRTSRESIDSYRHTSEHTSPPPDLPDSFSSTSSQSNSEQLVQSAMFVPSEVQNPSSVQYRSLAGTQQPSRPRMGVTATAVRSSTAPCLNGIFVNNGHTPGQPRQSQI
uniref:Robo2 protein n=1 Tax=Isodiametra pulchra TaxID=504439 RepID=A0A2P1DV80_ISOPU|nr:Robo2 protein [Isodiametra pulchra]